MSTTAPEADRPPVPFKIVSQQVQESFDPATLGQKTWTINYETPSGVTSFVTVPDSQYSAGRVAELVAADAARIEAVHQLTEGPAPAGETPGG